MNRGGHQRRPRAWWRRSRPEHPRSDQRDEVADAARRYRRQRRFVRLGQVLMLAGVVVAVAHWLMHLEIFGPGQPEGWVDLAAGYPMGALLLLVGAVIAGRKPA